MRYITMRFKFLICLVQVLLMINCITLTHCWGFGFGFGGSDSEETNEDLTASVQQEDESASQFESANTTQVLEQLLLLNQTEPLVVNELNSTTTTQFVEQLIEELPESNQLSTKESDQGTKPQLKLNCTPVFRDATNMTSQLVLVNTSTIAHYLQLKATPTLDIGPHATSHPTNQSIQIPGPCTVLIFYLDWCPFSAKAAAHFNALGRLFPQLNVLAIDAYNIYSTTMRYGVVGVPSAFVFHNNKLVSKYNKTELDIHSLVHYLQRITSLEPVGEVDITEADLSGPLSSQVAYAFNYTFVTSWIFCLAVASYYFSRSELFRRAKEHVFNMWNEAQFQHEHID